MHRFRKKWMAQNHKSNAKMPLMLPSILRLGTAPRTSNLKLCRHTRSTQMTVSWTRSSKSGQGRNPCPPTCKSRWKHPRPSVRRWVRSVIIVAVLVVAGRSLRNASSLYRSTLTLSMRSGWGTSKLISNVKMKYLWMSCQWSRSSPILSSRASPWTVTRRELPSK